MSRWKSLKENRRSPSECVFIRGGRRAQFKFTLRTCFCLASHLQIEKLRRVPSGEAQSFHVFVERREKTIHALSCLDTFLLLLVEQGKEAHQIRLVSSPAADKATIDRKMSKSKQLLGKIELGQIGTILFFFFFPAFGTMSLFSRLFGKTWHILQSFFGSSHLTDHICNRAKFLILPSVPQQNLCECSFCLGAFFFFNLHLLSIPNLVNASLCNAARCSSAFLYILSNCDDERSGRDRPSLKRGGGGGPRPK